MARSRFVAEGFGIDRNRAGHNMHRICDGLKPVAASAGEAAAGTAGDIVLPDGPQLQAPHRDGGRYVGSAGPQMDVLRKIGSKNGVEIENTLPELMRSKPFSPVRGMLGRNGEDWVPIHSSGFSVCRRSRSSRLVLQGSSSNHTRSLSVTVKSGSGRRRPRFGCGFGMAIGRISPSFLAVRSPDRNCPSGGSNAAAGMVEPSAISTRRCCADRIACSNRTRSNRALVRSSASRTDCGVPRSESRR